MWIIACSGMNVVTRDELYCMLQVRRRHNGDRGAGTVWAAQRSCDCGADCPRSTTIRVSANAVPDTVFEPFPKFLLSHLSNQISTHL